MKLNDAARRVMSRFREAEETHEPRVKTAAFPPFSKNGPPPSPDGNDAPIDGGTGGPSGSRRNIPTGHQFDPRALKPMSKALFATSVGLGNALTAYRHLNRLKSTTVSPDGMLGGRGYVMAVPEVRKRLYEAIESLSSIADTLYDEIQAPHWKPQLGMLDPNEAGDVSRLIEEAQGILASPEDQANAEIEEIETENDGGEEADMAEDPDLDEEAPGLESPEGEELEEAEAEPAVVDEGEDPTEETDEDAPWQTEEELPEEGMVDEPAEDLDDENASDDDVDDDLEEDGEEDSEDEEDASEPEEGFDKEGDPVAVDDQPEEEDADPDFDQKLDKKLKRVDELNEKVKPKKPKADEKVADPEAEEVPESEDDEDVKALPPKPKKKPKKKQKKVVEEEDEQSSSEMPGGGPGEEAKPITAPLKQAKVVRRMVRKAHSGMPSGLSEAPVVQDRGFGDGPFGSWNPLDDATDDSWGLENWGASVEAESMTPTDSTPSDANSWGLGDGTGEGVEHRDMWWGDHSGLPGSLPGSSGDPSDAMVDVFLNDRKALLNSLLPGDTQEPVARSDYYPGPKGNMIQSDCGCDANSALPSGPAAPTESVQPLVDTHYLTEDATTPYVHYNDYLEEDVAVPYDYSR